MGAIFKDKNDNNIKTGDKVIVSCGDENNCDNQEHKIQIKQYGDGYAVWFHKFGFWQALTNLGNNIYRTNTIIKINK